MSAKRRTYELPGIVHGAPIPMAARVGNTFRTSGISGRRPEDNSLPESATEQVDLMFSNARALMAAADVSLDDVVFLDVLLADDALRDDVNRHWLAWFPEEHDRPARHITVRELPGGLKAQLLLHASLGD